MGRPKPDPDLVEAALELTRAGTPASEIAEILNVPKATVTRWARAAKGSAAAAVPAHMAPPEAPDMPPIDPTDLLGSVRALLVDQHRQMGELRNAANPRGAQAAAANMAKVALLLKQLEGAERADAETLHIGRAGIEAAMRGVRERVAAILGRGELRCADCGRALSVKWGTGK